MFFENRAGLVKESGLATYDGNGLGSCCSCISVVGLILSAQSFMYGEFDPGSGRTLAACLRNASRAGLTLSGVNLAANGRVTRKQPALKTGTTSRKVC